MRHPPQDLWDEGTSLHPPPSVLEAAHDVFKLYTAPSQEMLHILRSRYSPGATFVDPLVCATSRNAIELQFYALHKMFTEVQVETRELRAAPVLEGRNSGLWQLTIDNTQRLTFARTKPISQQVLPEGTSLEVTTTLLIDPWLGQVVRHEDSWRNVPTPPMPMLCRRFNAAFTNTVWRLVGWGREVQQQAGGTAAAGLGGAAESHNS